MNTIPKLKINQIDLDETSNFRDIVLSNSYNQMRFFWNKPQELELAGIDYCFSSEYSSIKEFNDLAEYYRNIIKYNYDLLSDLNTPIIFIANSFDMESKNIQSPWTKFPKGLIFIPENIYINKNGLKKLITINKNKNTSKEKKDDVYNKDIRKLKSETSKKTFSNMVTDSIKMINQKKISKIVLSREKKFEFDFNIQRQSDFLSKAQSKFPDCTTFLYDFKNKGIFFGVTPETLFKSKQKLFYSEALAGTFQSDNAIKISDKSKELDEHNFVVKYIQKSISNFSDNIGCSKKPYLIKLNSITHMKTEFKSKLKSGIDPFDIIHNLHPTPAICGTPRDTAMSNIRRLETHQRGWYSGTLGWIDSEYNSHFIVSIRSGLSIDKNLYVYAGCGITKNSNKDSEYHESEIKFNSILSILNDE